MNPFGVLATQAADLWSLIVNHRQIFLYKSLLLDVWRFCKVNAVDFTVGQRELKSSSGGWRSAD